MTTPNLFSPSDPPSDPPTTAAPPPPAPRRPWPRGAVIGAALVALLVVGGTAVALLIPDGGPGRDVELAGGYAELSEPDLLADPLLDGDGSGAPAGQPGAGGPGRGDRGDRGIGGVRRLGDDTLLVGSIVSTSDGAVVVTPDGGPQRTLKTTDDTRVRGDGNRAVGDLQAGERVVIRVDGSGDGATAVTIVSPRARVAGTVKEISGDTATVTQVDGITVPVNVAAVDPKPAVGDLVVLSGRATDGTTITADRARVLPKSS